MKKSLLFLLAVFALIACSKDVETPVTDASTKAGDYLEVTAKTVLGKFLGDTLDIEVKSNTTWTASSSEPSWLVLLYGSGGTGDGTQKVQMYGRYNVTSPGTPSRSGTITFRTPSGLTKTVEMTQQADYRNWCDIHIELKDGCLRAMSQFAWTVPNLRVTVKFRINTYGSTYEYTSVIEPFEFWSKDKKSVYYSGSITPSITITSVTPGSYEHILFNVRSDQKP